MSEYHRDLFGGEAGWNADDWTSSDDRVRGGKSESHLDCHGSSAIFHGTLDIKTLGGAGFASQRTRDTSRSWDLSPGDGILLKLGEGDDDSFNKKYTLILKDEILEKRPDGREQSTVSWEYDFAGPDSSRDSKKFGTDGHGYVHYVPWSEFKPTYRGKPKSDAKPLDLASIKRISIMMRSFFGEQEGPFRLRIESIGVTTADGSLDKCKEAVVKVEEVEEVNAEDSEKAGHKASETPSWKDWMCGFLGY
jgi:hypothetical protein